MRTALLVAAALATATAVAACKSTSAAKSAEQTPPASTEAPAAPPTEGAAATPEAPRPWADGKQIHFDDLPDDLKGAFMKEVVVPTMKPLFQAHDAEEFKEFGCKTCHGASAKERKFEMPSSEIHVLDFAKDEAEHPGDWKFMKETVAPTMAKLLGEPPYDPATQKGFGCTHCHTAK